MENTPVDALWVMSLRVNEREGVWQLNTLEIAFLRTMLLESLSNADGEPEDEPSKEWIYILP